MASSRPHPFSTADILRATLGAAVLVTLANEVFRAMARALFSAPAEFRPLQPGLPGLTSALFVLIAGLVAVWVFQRSAEPAHAFWSLAQWALFASFVPIVMLLLVPSFFAGTQPVLVASLAFMHVIAFAIAVPMLCRVVEQ